MTIFRFSLLALLPAAAMAETVTLTNGHALNLYAVIVEPDTGIARFRFQGDILAAVAPDSLVPTMQGLCDDVALPEVQAMGATVSQIIITLSDREVPQGTIDHAAIQFFEGFSIATGACVWEPY
jgi:hypothetical protein